MASITHYGSSSKKKKIGACTHAHAQRGAPPAFNPRPPPFPRLYSNLARHSGWDGGYYCKSDRIVLGK